MTKKGIEKRTYQGVVYDSETELKFLLEWIEPKLKTGEISRYERQVPYILQEGYTNFIGKKILPIKYVADYVIYYPNDDYIVVDVKGQADNTAKLKRKLFWKKYPDIKYYWYCRNIKYGGETHWLLYDELQKKRKEAKKAKK